MKSRGPGRSNNNNNNDHQSTWPAAREGGIPQQRGGYFSGSGFGISTGRRQSEQDGRAGSGVAASVGGRRGRGRSEGWLIARPRLAVGRTCSPCQSLSRRRIAAAAAFACRSSRSICRDCAVRHRGATVPTEYVLWNPIVGPLPHPVIYTVHYRSISIGTRLMRIEYTHH